MSRPADLPTTRSTNRPRFFRRCLPLLVPVIVLALASARAQQTEISASGKPAAQEKKRTARAGRAAETRLPVISPFSRLDDPDVHEDFPAMCLSAEGDPVAVYIEHDGERDTLKLAGLDSGGRMHSLASVSAPGVDNIVQPCLARLNNDRILCVWSQLQDDGQWDLFGRIIGRRGKAALGKPQRITRHAGNDIFADLGTDRHGRTWLAWQRMAEGVNRIVTCHRSGEDGSWSDELLLPAGDDGGDWEPRLAFGAGGDAHLVFDSYRNGDFDVFRTKVSPEGTVGEIVAVAATDRYEARAEAAASDDGGSLWVVYEDGMKRWGKDLGAEWRKKGGGLHHDRQLKVVKVDLETGEVQKTADITDLLPDLVADPRSVGTGAIDVPEIIVDAAGHPWVFFRYCLFNSPGYWQIALSRLDPDDGTWTRPEVLDDSAFCLDRRCAVSVNPRDGLLTVVYPGDSRKNKQAGNAGIHLATVSPGKPRASAGKLPFQPEQGPPSLLKPYNGTPERGRSDHHSWNVNGETYHLRWGDVHRHTDFSNCRTTDDGCIVEHYRYAIEAGGLDFLGTSDHTEVGKTYTPYEWWQTQKFADLFHNPGSFVSIYAYEREQKFPYGHRNVLFEKRGGPIIYIKRKNYSASPYATPLPAPDGAILGDIPPWQLWDLLRIHGKRAITIEHTSAGAMGTDWSQYKDGGIDGEFENVLEVFQGSRESSEGQGAPQPPVIVGSAQNSKFGTRAATGTWQKALSLQHRLGAFASSDHRSTNLSYGGVYVKDFTRKGLFDAMDARRTIAATDKIYMEFSCNGHLMGEIFETGEPPELKMVVHGTAPISRVTLVRNETDFEVFTPPSPATDFSRTYLDKNPIAGENRYYLRVEQIDGNMGWTSPVWVTVR